MRAQREAAASPQAQHGRPQRRSRPTQPHSRSRCQVSPERGPSRWVCMAPKCVSDHRRLVLLCSNVAQVTNQVQRQQRAPCSTNRRSVIVAACALVMVVPLYPERRQPCSQHDTAYILQCSTWFACTTGKTHEESRYAGRAGWTTGDHSSHHLCSTTWAASVAPML